MEFIAHRINTLEELKNTPQDYGVELDVRDDLTGRIYLQHDPFTDGADFEDYLRAYHHKTMILNVKSERIEHRVLELVKKYHVRQYFFLDSSFPMIKLLSDMGVRNIALRFSEYEGMDTLKAMAGKVDWVWADTFNQIPLNYKIYMQIREMGYKICLVSPELQGQPEKLEAYALQLKRENIKLDAICSKVRQIGQWKDLAEQL